MYTGDAKPTRVHKDEHQHLPSWTQLEGDKGGEDDHLGWKDEVPGIEANTTSLLLHGTVVSTFKLFSETEYLFKR